MSHSIEHPERFSAGVPPDSLACHGNARALQARVYTSRCERASASSAAGPPPCQRGPPLLARAHGARAGAPGALEVGHRVVRGQLLGLAPPRGAARGRQRGVQPAVRQPPQRRLRVRRQLAAAGAGRRRRQPRQALRDGGVCTTVSILVHVWGFPSSLPPPLATTAAGCRQRQPRQVVCITRMRCQTQERRANSATMHVQGSTARP